MKNNNFIIIDGNSLINRAYFAIRRPMITRDGVYTHGIYGFLNMLEKLIKMYPPKLIGVAFDVKGKTFRHNMFDGYKSGRKGMDLELAMQLPILKDILLAMNIKTIEKEGYEADDLIGTLAREAERKGYKTLIVTGDRDSLQLVSENTSVIYTKKGISEFTNYDVKTFEEEYNFPPEILIDYKALSGDKSDNIPGVAGIGDGTAKKLLWEYENLDKIYENIEDISSKATKKKLEDGRLDAYMSQKLAKIDTNVPISLELDEYKYEEPNYENLIELYKRLEFSSFLSKLNLKDAEVKNSIELPKFEKILVEDEELLKELLEAIQKSEEIGLKIIDGEEEREKYKRIRPLIGILCQEKVFGLEINSSNLDRVLLEIEKNKKKIFGHQIRNEIVLMMKRGIKCFDVSFDTAIGAYLIDSNKSDYSIDKLGDSVGVKVSLEKEVNQLTFDDELNRKYFAEQLENLEKKFGVILALRESQEDEIRAQNMDRLLRDLELPLIEVMASMQYYGFSIDRNKLSSIRSMLNQRIEELRTNIVGLAGEEFNINSPRQLGEILFEKMGLTSGKKTKTGYSTNAETLEKIKDESPIIEFILEYRKLTKLMSTYVDGLIAVLHDDERIHSQFNQTVASTGRISSSNPNMQNIPIRDELGKNIRGAFVSSENFVLVGADYSQIELRVLADMSGDEALIESFNNGDDIHRATAARVMGISPNEVTNVDRSNAKAINFGVIYGMGAFSLSEDLQISWFEAEKYINDYFEKHEKVKIFMDAQKELAKEKGYVETILGRRRYIPEINAKNMIVKQQGSRLAMNTPIQGSAADIIKIAMLKVYGALRAMKSRLILQVHDELIIEAHKDELNEVESLLKEAMESAIKLKVDLKVDLNTGNNWLELK